MKLPTEPEPSLSLAPDKERGVIEPHTTVESMQERARELMREGYIVLKSICSCCEAFTGYSCFREGEADSDSIRLAFRGYGELTEEVLNRVYQKN